VDTRQLRRKLEVAIQVMQTGLVERDTEVGGAAVVACLRGARVCVCVCVVWLGVTHAGRSRAAPHRLAWYARSVVRCGSCPEAALLPLLRWPRATSCAAAGAAAAAGGDVQGAHPAHRATG
jgi:hypothetical protein